MFDTVKQLYLQRERERLYKSQDWKELAGVCRKLLEITPNDFKALHDLVVALRELKDFGQAAPWCEAVLKAAPKVAPEQQLALEGPRYMRYLVACGEILAHQGELERARRLLLPLKKAGTHFHKKHILLCDIYEKQGDLARAVSELEEMQEIYSNAGIHQWEHVILVRCRQILPVALAKRDADATLIAYRVIVKVCLRKSEVDKYIQARESDPALGLEVRCLKAAAALLQNLPEEAEQAARGMDWPELADRILALARFKQGRSSECAEVLRRLPPTSKFHLELAGQLKQVLFNQPEFLRDYAQCHLCCGMLEDAYEAYQALTTHAACELQDLERFRDLRLLLLERAIWEDEARLGLKSGLSAGTPGQSALAQVDSIPLNYQGKEIGVGVSAGFKISATHAVPVDLSEIKFRLAENYLRRGVNQDTAARFFQELSQQQDLGLKARALCQLALHFVRKGDPQVAQTALGNFFSAAAQLPEEERKRMLLDMGDSCDAAGMAEQAKICYASILTLDIAYADVQERMRSLESGRKPVQPTSEAATSRIRERYADLRAIGRGGMGVVYKAYDPLYARTVALKVLSERYRGDEAAVSRFLREGQAMAQLLRHPGIVRVYEVGVGHDLYIAMEFVQGSSLRAVLKEKGRLSMKEIADIGVQVCEALGFAHENGIIHRDVKPDNVLLTSDGKVKLVDFGLADISTATVLTQVGTVMGTGQYMSPEQIRGKEADARSDIYSFGAMLFELAAGRVPFPKGDLAYMHLNEQVPSLRGLAPGVSASFEALVLRCMEKDPAKRFPSCAELARSLKEAA